MYIISGLRSRRRGLAMLKNRWKEVLPSVDELTQPPACQTCRKSADFVCQRCGVTYYCSKACQTLDFERHVGGIECAELAIFLRPSSALEACTVDVHAEETARSRSTPIRYTAMQAAAAALARAGAQSEIIKRVLETATPIALLYGDYAVMVTSDGDAVECAGHSGVVDCGFSVGSDRFLTGCAIEGTFMLRDAFSGEKLRVLCAQPPTVRRDEVLYPFLQQFLPWIINGSTLCVRRDELKVENETPTRRTRALLLQDLKDGNAAPIALGKDERVETELAPGTIRTVGTAHAKILSPGAFFEIVGVGGGRAVLACEDRIWKTADGGATLSSPLSPRIDLARPKRVIALSDGVAPGTFFVAVWSVPAGSQRMDVQKFRYDDEAYVEHVEVPVNLAGEPRGSVRLLNLFDDVVLLCYYNPRNRGVRAITAQVLDLKARTVRASCVLEAPPSGMASEYADLKPMRVSSEVFALGVRTQNFAHVYALAFGADGQACRVIFSKENMPRRRLGGYNFSQPFDGWSKGIMYVDENAFNLVTLDGELNAKVDTMLLPFKFDGVAALPAAKWR